jgi:ferric-dicitrate binding protein FerR (iron transport regulator)
LERYESGVITPAEQVELEQWYAHLRQTDQPFLPADEKAKQQQLQHLLQNIHQGIASAPAPVVPMKRRWSRWVAAAMLLIIPAAGWLWYSSRTLSSAAIAQSITVPAGKTQLVSLPDSSHVWLAEGSVFQYSTDYGQATRTVILQKGKAFFEVQKDPEHPFVVKAGSLQTTVLGTSFTVDIDKTQKPLVAVATGKVKVSLHEKELSVLLPGKQLQADVATGQFQVRERSAAFVDAWTKQQLSLTNVHFDELAQAFQAFYGVTIYTENTGLRPNKYNILLQRNVEATKVLQVICALYHNQYRPMPDGSYRID